MQPTEEQGQNPAIPQNITYSEAVKMNTDIYQPMLDSDGMVDATSIVVNKIEESVTVLVDSNTPVSPKPVQVRKISRFQVSHVQEDTIPKINPVPYITPVEVKLKKTSARKSLFY